MISPSIMLGLIFALFVSSALVVRRQQSHLRRKLRRLAVANRLHYSPVDRFGLGARTLESWLSESRPLNIDVQHVMYGREGTRRQFVYAVEFQLGGAVPRVARRIIKAHEGADEAGAIPLELEFVRPVEDSIVNSFSEALGSDQSKKS